MGNSGIGVPLPELAAYCREAAAEGAVLLKNEGHMLPVKKDETVSIFGRSQIEYYRSGTGSGGAVNVPYVKNILDGIKENNAFPVNEELVETYKEWLKEHPFDNGGGGWAAEPWHQEEMEITEEIACRAAEKSKKAVFLIGRTAGEDKDYEDTEGSYLLTKREKENLRVVTKYFNEVAVLLNVSNIIDMSWTKDAAYQDHIKAILYIWQGGMEGANAVADLLSGRVTPSGKLTDTIAEKLSDYPAADHFGSKTENIYEEDIYVGYRYFETFAPEKVMYEFGFGLSYTEISMETVKAESTGNGAGYGRHGAERADDIRQLQAGAELQRRDHEPAQRDAPRQGHEPARRKDREVVERGREGRHRGRGRPCHGQSHSYHRIRCYGREN